MVGKSKSLGTGGFSGFGDPNKAPLSREAKEIILNQQSIAAGRTFKPEEQFTGRPRSNNPPIPQVTEVPEPAGVYRDEVAQQVIARGVDPASLLEMKEGMQGQPKSANQGAAGARRIMDEDGSGELRPATQRELLEEAVKTQPSLNADVFVDPSYLNNEVAEGNPLHKDLSSMSATNTKLNAAEDYLKGLRLTDPEFKGSTDRFLSTHPSMDTTIFSNAATTALAGSIYAQSSFVAGKRETPALDGDIQGGIGSKFEDKGVISRIGMTSSELISSTAHRLRDHMDAFGAEVDLSGVDPHDYTIVSTRLVEEALGNGDLVTTRIHGQDVVLPTGNDNVGNLLGQVSDAIVGDDKKVGLGVATLLGGVSPLIGKELKHNSGRKRPNKTNIDDSMVVTDMIGKMPVGSNLTSAEIAVYSLMDTLRHMKSPLDQGQMAANSYKNPDNILIYSESDFAGEYKMDKGSITASWRKKVIQMKELLGEENLQRDPVDPTRYDLNPLQYSEITDTVNKITKNRRNGYLVNFNKQVGLIVEEGLANKGVARFVPMSTFDINRRMASIAHDAQFASDKMGSRQIIATKIHAYVKVDPSNFEKFNTNFNKVAKELFAIEGNDDAWQSKLNSMGKPMEYELSFRISMVRDLLRTGRAAFKKKSKGISLTDSEQTAYNFTHGTGMGMIRNPTHSLLYQVYMEMNAKDPTTLLRYFGKQGRDIRNTIDSASVKLVDLPYIKFDPNQTPDERASQTIEAWKDYTIKDHSVLAELVNKRGDALTTSTIRETAMNYMEAIDSGNLTHVEMLAEYDPDATQSGPHNQTIVAPTKNGLFIEGLLGSDPNTTLGDLRDHASELLLGGDLIKGVFKDPQASRAWIGFIRDALTGDRDGTVRELMLKQPITQFYYGKPANRFTDLAAEMLGWFPIEIDNVEYIKGLSDTERVAELALVIQGVLQTDKFDSSFAEMMKKVGMYLAMTDGDMIVHTPFGDANLSKESMHYEFENADKLAAKGMPQELKISAIEFFDAGTEQTIKHPFKSAKKSNSGPKNKPYNQSQLITGDNNPTSPGRDFADSIGVLILHQLESMMLNHTIIGVNKNRNDNELVAARPIFDSIITNGGGLLRYTHYFNNVTIPALRNWDFFEALGDMVKEAETTFIKKRKTNRHGVKNKDGKLSEHYNISVIRGEDGNLHPVERYAVLTSWLDKYYIDIPNEFDHPDEVILEDKLLEYNTTHPRLTKAINQAKGTGYIPPIFNPFYLEHGYLPIGQDLVLNASERANMFLSLKDFELLHSQFAEMNRGGLATAAVRNKQRKKEIAASRDKVPSQQLNNN